MKFQVPLGSSSFSSANAADVDCGKEPSVARNSPQLRTTDRSCDQPRTLPTSPLSCSKPTRYASSGETPVIDSAISLANLAMRWHFSLTTIQPQWAVSVTNVREDRISRKNSASIIAMHSEILVGPPCPKPYCLPAHRSKWMHAPISAETISVAIETSIEDLRVTISSPKIVPDITGTVSSSSAPRLHNSTGRDPRQRSLPRFGNRFDRACTLSPVLPYIGRSRRSVHIGVSYSGEVVLPRSLTIGCGRGCITSITRRP